MASRDTSLDGFLQAGGDSIPRGYQRRVLKKIAQLTKVIYALNTKNDENEQFVAKLKATHEEDIDKILSDSTHKLQLCKAKLSLEQEAAENKAASLMESLEIVEKEKNYLHEEQVSYRMTVVEKMESIKAQYSDKVLLLTKELENLKSNQAQQLKEFSELRVEFSKNSSGQIEQLKQRHHKEIEGLKKKLEGEFSSEKASLKAQHQKEVAHLKEEFEQQIKSHEVSLTKSCNEKVATEKRLSEERENTLRHQLIQKEEQLKHQVSTLSNDLRIARDKLALSEQKVSDLLSQHEEGQASSTEIGSQLKESEEELEKLKVVLRETKNELEISKEHYQQQLVELKRKAANKGRLEALCVSNEGIIKDLQSQITGLEQKILLLEEERNALKGSQDSVNEYQTAQIKSLEMDLAKMRQQKDELRVQFAREIEAAHAQLGENETRLIYEHLITLQQLRDEKKQVALDAKKDKDAALEELQRQMQLQREEEVGELKQRLESENSQLRRDFSDKSSELELALVQLKRLESELAKREQGLGSAASSLEALKAELMTAQGDLMASRKEKEGAVKERDRLLSNVEGLKEQARELRRINQDQLVRLRKEVSQEVENRWKERLKEECRALREELSSRYSDDSRTALAELANIKDRAFDSAWRKWETEKEKLLTQVSDLERRLHELQDSSSAVLDKAKTSSYSQITALKHELEELKAHHLNLVEQDKDSHSQEIEALKKQFTAEKDELSESLREQHDREKQNLQQANQLAVHTLREKLQHKNQCNLERVRLEQNRKMADLQVELLAEFERDKKNLHEEHELEIQTRRDRMEKLMAERNIEVSQYERAMSDLSSDIDRRDAELSKLRDKVNSLTVAVSSLKKELEVKGHEVLMIRREANTQLQQYMREVSAAHNVEVESLGTQHKHQYQILLSEFNNAKAIFVNKISELESQLSEWEHRYNSRDSKPEDLELIRELRLVTQQQKQKMKNLIAEKRVYQLELINREKNYNQIFNANPYVGVLDPLGSKKKHTLNIGNRYPSAPSLMTPTPEPPQPPLPSPHPPYAAVTSSCTTLTTTIPGSLIPHPPHLLNSRTASTGQLFTKRERQPSPPAAAKPLKFVTLKDSPLNRHKVSSGNGKEKRGGVASVLSGENVGLPMNPLESTATGTSTQKHTMAVQ